MLLLPLLLLPLIELAVIIWVGTEVGVLSTIGLLVVIGMLGIALLMYAGIGTARRFRADLAAGRVPDRAALDTLVIVGAGLLLLLPGFLSDLAAIWLLLPPGRALARRSIARGGGRRFASRTTIIDVQGRPVSGDPRPGSGPAPGRTAEDPRHLPPGEL